MEVPFCLLDVDHFVENEKPIIRIHGKTKEGSMTILDRNFLPYIYVLPNGEIEHLKNLILNSFSRIPIKKIEQVKKNYLGKDFDFLKVSILYPADIKDLKEEISSWKSVKKVFERDIHFYKRYMIDKGLYPFKWYNPVFDGEELISLKEVDGETPQLDTISINIEAGDRISSIRTESNNGVSKVFAGEEKSILESFIHEIRGQDPDVICGYDTDSFIFPSLIEAAKRNSIPFEIGRFAGEPFIKKTGRIIGHYIKGRIHIDLSHIDILIGNDDKGSAINDFKKLLPKIVELSILSGQTAFDATRMDQFKVMEWIMIREALKNNEVIPSKPGFEEAERRKSSGYKKETFVEAKEGLYEGICKTDIRGIYNGIITHHNVSPETLNCDCCKRSLVSTDLAFIENRAPGEQYYFCTHHIGFFPKVIGYIENEKTSLTKTELLEKITKSVHNYFSHPWSRWYSAVCAKSIISWGKETLTNAFGDKWKDIIYADSDIVFSSSDTINIELDGTEKSLFVKGFVFAGKSSPKYILLDTVGKIIDKGFEKNKSDWSVVTKETYNKILELILKEGKEEEALKLFNETVQEINEEKLPVQKFAMEMKLAKNINDYERIDPHVSAAKKGIEAGEKIPKGSAIKYVITKEGKSISDKSVLVNYAKSYDSEYYSSQLESACSKLFSRVGDQNRQGLGKFMEK